MKPLFVQYTYSAPVEEYNAMVYVKRRDTFHVDSSPDLYGESLNMWLLSSETLFSKEKTETLMMFCSSLSDSVQLLCGSLRLQPLPHSRPQVRLCVVWRRSGQLLVFRLL